MSDSSLFRVISLVLAISAAMGGWMLLGRDDPRAGPVAPPPAALDSGSSVSLREALPVVQETALPVLMPRDKNITYKCQKYARISYSDRPCPADERTLAVTATEKEVPASGNNLSRLREQVAVMKSERSEPQKVFDLEAVAAVATVRPYPGKELRCQQIDDEIVNIDSRLRQPPYAQNGDYWTGERKKLTDERFSLRC